MVMITLYVRQQKRHRCIEQSFGLCGRGWVDLGEWHWNMYNIIYIASPGLMHDTGCSGLVHWDDPEGWYGEGGWKGLRMGNTCTPVADSCWCIAKPIHYCKVISLQLNKFILKNVYLQIRQYIIIVHVRVLVWNTLHFLFSFHFLAIPCSVRDLSVLTRGWTCAPCSVSTES